jgi:hypothetical protein
VGGFSLGSELRSHTVGKLPRLSGFILYAVASGWSLTGRDRTDPEGPWSYIMQYRIPRLLPLLPKQDTLNTNLANGEVVPIRTDSKTVPREKSELSQENCG